MEIRIQETLPPERREACWLFVASVQTLAESRAQRAVSDCVEQGMLYNILMAETWKAAESYDPAKGTKFSTWVFRPWGYAIKEFWRVKRLQNESLSASGNDPDNQSTLLDQIEDPDSPYPDDAYAYSELSAWADSTLEAGSLLKIMIDDTCEQYDWLCPFCRRAVRKKIKGQIFSKPMMEDYKNGSKHDVYARRRSWNSIV